MERTKHHILIGFFVFLTLWGSASERSIIYSSYLSGNMQQWCITIDRMEGKAEKGPVFLQELLNYQYGYIAWCLSNKRNTEAEKYLEKAEHIVNELEKNAISPSVTNAYKAAFYGYRIGLNKWKAPFWGPKSETHARLAVRQEPGNWFAWVQLGNIAYYKPAAFGGSKAEGLEHYLKAEALMEKEPELCRENWNYLNLLTLIAEAYIATNKYEKAKSYFEKILRIEPGFRWVKNELYPSFIKQYKETRHE